MGERGGYSRLTFSRSEIYSLNILIKYIVIIYRDIDDIGSVRGNTVNHVFSPRRNHSQ